MKTCVKCGSPFPFWVTIDGKRRNLKNRQKCLGCLPFGSSGVPNRSGEEQLIMELLRSLTGPTTRKDLVNRFFRRRPRTETKEVNRAIASLIKKGALFLNNGKLDIPDFWDAKCELCNKRMSKRRKKCPACVTKIRRYRVKLAAIKLLGGKCVDCGLREPHYVFEFHHKDGAIDKDFTISRVSNMSWEKLKGELEKCILLCANCHRIRHREHQYDDKFVQAALNYDGVLQL